jgi:hypothetical protein
VKRLLLLGLLLGLANALAAFVTLYAIYRVSGPDEVFGYFGSAPGGVVYDSYYDFPWEYVAIPAVLIVLNAALLPLAVRRGWPGR